MDDSTLQATSTTEWVSVTKAVELLGIPRTEIMACIHNALIPFHKNGSRYTLNLKLVRAYFCRMDIENMKRGRSEITTMPLSNDKVTTGLGNYGRNNSQSNPRIRRVEL